MYCERLLKFVSDILIAIQITDENIVWRRLNFFKNFCFQLFSRSRIVLQILNNLITLMPVTTIQEINQRFFDEIRLDILPIMKKSRD